MSVVFGACDFSEFDKNFMKVGTKERQRLHNEIKNAYIKSVINDDLECKKASLERLIKANDVFGVNSKTLKKEYNIRFKIYPSPFTSLPQPSFHIFIIELPTFVFWGYPSEIFRYLSEIFSYPSEIFCYLSELCSYPSEIFFRMIP